MIHQEPPPHLPVYSRPAFTRPLPTLALTPAFTSDLT